MLANINDKNIYIASKPVDFRLSINGLVNLVQDDMGEDCYSNNLYVFYNKACNKLKLIYWDKNGFVLVYKKLQDTYFKINSYKGLKSLDENQLKRLLSALTEG